MRSGIAASATGRRFFSRSTLTSGREHGRLERQPIAGVLASSKLLPRNSGDASAVSALGAVLTAAARALKDDAKRSVSFEFGLRRQGIDTALAPTWRIHPASPS